MSRLFPSILQFSANRGALPYRALVVFFLVLFILGGSSRSDTQSLVIVLPATVLFLGYGLWGLAQEHIAAYRFLFAIAFAILCLTALHLIPLPAVIWQALPSSDLLIEIDGAIGTPQVWRPVSMVPGATWKALCELLVPVTALVLISQLDREYRFKFLSVFIFLGLASGILGLMQSVGPSNGQLYLYKITNGNLAVGLFANRNHHAVFLSCLFPMLAAYASLPTASSEVVRLRFWLAIACSTMLIPLILVTGSRAGLLTAILGILATPLLYREPKSDGVESRKVRKLNLAYVLGSIGVAAMAFITALAARAETFVRLFDDDRSSDMRFSTWGPIWTAAEKYFPLGSGIGSFVEVYQIDELRGLLTFQYFPHAHNDWIEVALTSGLPAILLIVASAIAFGLAAWSNFRADKHESRDILFGRLGVVIIALLGIASVADYPLRIPSLGSLIVIAAIWASRGSDQLSKSAGSA
jgi:O-Antigen ligase